MPSTEAAMRRHYIDTEVWRDGKRGVITNVDRPSSTVCVDWGTNEPEWIKTNIVRSLRTARTRDLKTQPKTCNCPCTCGARK